MLECFGPEDLVVHRVAALSSAIAVAHAVIALFQLESFLSSSAGLFGSADLEVSGSGSAGLGSSYCWCPVFTGPCGFSFFGCSS